MDNYIVKESHTEFFDASTLSERSFLPGDTTFLLIGWNVWPGKYFEKSEASIKLSALTDELRERYLRFSDDLISYIRQMGDDLS